MNRFSRIRHHIDMEDVKLKYLDNLAAKKIEEEHKNKLNEILEKKKYQWRESFTNITTGNKVGQTFRHNPSGQTVSTAGALGGVESIPSTVSVFGDNVPGPNASLYAIQGYAKPLGNVLKRKKTEDTNKKLDASQEFARKVGADEIMDARVNDNNVKDSLDNVAKILSDKIKNLLKDKGDVLFNRIFQKVFPFATDRFASEARTFLKYLTGTNNKPITNKSISKSHLRSLFQNATITGGGRVNMKDFIVGTGQRLQLDPNTNKFYFTFTYDFNNNATELLKRNVGGWTRFTTDLIGAKHGYDSNALYGKMIDIAKSTGRGQAIKGRFDIPASELMNINKEFVRDSIKASSGYDIAENGYQIFSPDFMNNLFAKGGDVTSPESMSAVHAYYAATGKIPEGAKPKGTVPMNKYDHPEYDPAVIKRIKIYRDTKSTDIEKSRDGDIKKAPSKAVNRIKSMSKTRRQSLSLDEPIIRRKKKKT